ncbi:hypothetical protein BCR34DRAFT_493531, partial [Clohesyomyces aquaticus]
KKQCKWTPEEDNLTIELRGQGMKWNDITKRLTGRTPMSCRLRYQNYLEKRAIWDDEQNCTLGMLKDQMWQKVATEMGITCRSAESMHWQLGEQEMSARAYAPVPNGSVESGAQKSSQRPCDKPAASPLTFIIANDPNEFRTNEVRKITRRQASLHNPATGHD